MIEEYIIYAAVALVCFAAGGMIRKLTSLRRNKRTENDTAKRETKQKKTKKTSKTPVLSMSDVDAMNGHDFEYFCAELLKKNGFKKVKVTPASGDQGVDVIAVKGTARYAIQCKRYASPLGNKPVQEVYTGKTFYDCRYGVVMTNSTFTPHAKDLAKKTGVLLWDRKVIQSMMNGERKKL